MKSRRDFKTEAEYRAYKLSPEWGRYMNSRKVTTGQRKVLVDIRDYKQKREVQRAKHLND
jgi:hypothetical protein